MFILETNKRLGQNISRLKFDIYEDTLDAATSQLAKQFQSGKEIYTIVDGYECDEMSGEANRLTDAEVEHINYICQSECDFSDSVNFDENYMFLAAEEMENEWFSRIWN
jgi:hypothetical protein